MKIMLTEMSTQAWLTCFCLSMFSMSQLGKSMHFVLLYRLHFNHSDSTYAIGVKRVQKDDTKSHWKGNGVLCTSAILSGQLLLNNVFLKLIVGLNIFAAVAKKSARSFKFSTECAATAVLCKEEVSHDGSRGGRSHHLHDMYFEDLELQKLSGQRRGRTVLGQEYNPALLHLILEMVQMQYRFRWSCFSAFWSHTDSLLPYIGVNHLLSSTMQHLYYTDQIIWYVLW